MTHQDETKALWFTQRSTAVVKKEVLNPPKKKECLVKTLFSAVSPGTERLVFTGKVPLSLYPQMRCPYMEGSFHFPLKYGYSLVGQIIQGPQARIGDLVHILHPHQNFCVVRLEDTYPVPDPVPPERATLASNLETAVTALWDSKIRLGERVLIVGFGIIGSLVARLVRFFLGTEGIVVETNQHKRELARSMGFTVSGWKSLDKTFDLAFHASGTEEGLRLAIESLGPEGRVVELSWYGTTEVTLSLGESFHAQRKKIVSSQVSSIPSELKSRWDQNRRKSLVFSLLQRSEFDQHITHSLNFSKLPQLFKELEKKPTPGLGYLVKY